MGCGASVGNSKVGDIGERAPKANSIQDEARLFRSNVGAIKMITRNALSRESFAQYLGFVGKAEYLACFQDLEEIKLLSEDQIVSRTAALIWRYKSMYESVKILGVKPDNMKYLVWESLGKLRQIDIVNIQKAQLMNYIALTQNELLSRLVVPFEGFMASDFYKQWQDNQLEAEKQRKAVSSKPSTPQTSVSGKPDTYSGSHPDVLIVDDSIITLKLTGLTLERDGHHVDKAANGQIALDLMKSRQYDVVLIDINMPVMDGFETVRLFRDFEKNNVPAYFPSDVSDLSEIESEKNGMKQREAPKTDLGSFKARQTNNSRKNGSDNTDNTAANQTQTVQGEGNVLFGDIPVPRRKPSMSMECYHQLIIGMSTDIDRETRDKALASGMDYFLPKPFTLQKFVETIRKSKNDPSIIA